MKEQGSPEKWELSEALALCTAIHNIPSQKFNCHPALTGGLLYKTGPRKDCDIVIYQRGDVDGVRQLLRGACNRFMRMPRSAWAGLPPVGWRMQ